MKRWFQRVVLARRWATFLVMGLSFVIFGAGSLNLFYVFKANVALLLEQARELAAIVSTLHRDYGVRQ